MKCCPFFKNLLPVSSIICLSLYWGIINMCHVSSFLLYGENKDIRLHISKSLSTSTSTNHSLGTQSFRRRWQNSSEKTMINLINENRQSVSWKLLAESDKKGVENQYSYEDLDFENEIDFASRTKIEDLVQQNKIVLFMKGNKLFPGCGFSATAARILESLNVEFKDVDVAADFRLKEELKRYSEWPTIPQLYLQGEFIGGADIMIEMYQTGELQESIEIAAAS